MKTFKLILRIAVSLSVSGLFVWLSLRHAPIGEVVHAIGQADLRWLGLYFLLLFAIHLVRTVRWGELLVPLGRIPFARLNSASAVGIMLLLVLPLRLGEFARPLLVARPVSGTGPRLRRSAAFASIFVERIADGLYVGILGIIALHQLGSRASGPMADFARRAALLVTGGFFVGCVGLVAAFFLREQAVALVKRVLNPLSPRFAGKAASMLDAFIDGLHLGSALRVFAFFLTTAFYWTLAACGLYLAGRAFGMHLGPLDVSTVLAVQVVGVMVPAGPGMVGTFQFFTQAGLAIFLPGANGGGPEAVRGAAFANTIWLLQFIQQVGLGLIFMGLGHVSLRGLFAASEEPIDAADSAAGASANAPVPAAVPSSGGQA